MNIEQNKTRIRLLLGNKNPLLSIFSTNTSLCLWNNGSLQVVPHRELFVPSFKSKRFEASQKRTDQGVVFKKNTNPCPCEAKHNWHDKKLIKQAALLKMYKWVGTKSKSHPARFRKAR